MNKLPDFRRFRVVWYLVFRLVLADNCSLLRPIFPFDQCIAYPQFIVYDYPFDIFKLFLFSDIVLLIWNMTGHFMEYELCIGLEKKNRECVIKDKHLLTFARTWVHPPPPHFWWVLSSWSCPFLVVPSNAYKRKTPLSWTIVIIQYIVAFYS
jgi:hypothetical protein